MRNLLTLLLAIQLLSCSIPTPLLERIKQDGELVVITRNSATTYYEGREGIAGIEHDLVRMFARELGVRVRFVIPESFDQIIPMIKRREAHFAAAGLTVTKDRKVEVKFSPSYQQITQQLIFRNGSQHPKNLSETIGSKFEVLAGSSHAAELNRRKQKIPGLEWVERRELESEELLYMVHTGEIDYTIADSNETALNRRFYPELLVAFNLTAPEQLAWAFPHEEDSSLFDAAAEFIRRIKKSGQLDQLIERYYGHVERLGFVDTNTFKRHVLTRLPKYIGYFKDSAKATGIEWELLAAIGYQESHWNPDAVSPTGVRGIMMLTEATAEQLDIEDRTVPEQSIIGGANYLQLISEKIPPSVVPPDRMWFILAAYNVGFGHLEDARILAQRDGKNPDKWQDVKQYLPLLSRQAYYRTVKHGYARGREPVDYVDNIRGYHDLLTWLIDQSMEGEQSPPDIFSSSVL